MTSKPVDPSKESVAAVEAMLRATYDALRDGEPVRPIATEAAELLADLEDDCQWRQKP